MVWVGELEWALGVLSRQKPEQWNLLCLTKWLPEPQCSRQQLNVVLRILCSYKVLGSAS
jgi:hypothetical protein